ncbi:unnamed protein product [Linum tenue]|uniref:DUF4378 domain-containing protein n=1 Tax=Linum tenue TaxID=586396 RepID=A0AAV0JHD5_9ROSI|nr:unnamed protein product [Linum tenue]
MAKKSQRRPAGNAKPGCMWGLINMLDFRHGRVTQKLLPDKRLESRHVPGHGYDTIKHDLSPNSDEKTSDGKGNLVLNTEFRKPSVKKLIEEDLLNEQTLKSEINDNQIQPKLEQEERQRKRSSKRTKRGRSKSCEIHVEDLNAADIREHEQPCAQKLAKQSSDSLYVGEIIEEFCHQLHQKGSNCIKHGEDCEFHHPKQSNINFEERLSEALNIFVRQKHPIEEENIPSSKELTDALHILCSDEELASRLLLGQKSMIMKQLEKALISQVENDDSKSLVGSSTMKEEHEPVLRKHRRFFRRSKSLANFSSEEIDTFHASNRIVILKPGPTKDATGSLRQSQMTAEDTLPNERGSSHFSLTEIKRRLRNAMAKESRNVSTVKRYTNEAWAAGDGDRRRFKENTGKSSPGKEHFFIEKVARLPPTSPKKSKEPEQSMQDEDGKPIKQSVSDIYLEAKKHLSEMLITGTGDVDFPSRQFSKPLGRILSFPEYNSSPFGSPGRDSEHSFVTARMRLPNIDSLGRREGNISHLGKKSLSSDAPSSDIEAQAPTDQTSSSSNELVHVAEVEKSVGSMQDEMMTQGYVEIEDASEIIITPEEGNVINNLSETSSCSVIINDQNGVNSSEVRDEKADVEPLEHESSPLDSPSKRKHDDLEATDVPDRPSPVSVLEPYFSEEDVELSLQPLRIEFEEQGSSSGDHVAPSKTTDHEDSMLKYIKDVLLDSGLNWDEFYLMSDSSDQILNPSSCHELEFYPDQFCNDKQLLFNCIDEVLMEVYDFYFGSSPGLSLGNPASTRPIPDMNHTIDEVCERLHWHLRLLPSPRTLDQVVKRDMAKNGSWMDLRRDSETALVDICEDIFERLIEETVFGLSSSESDSSSSSICL